MSTCQVQVSLPKIRLIAGKKWWHVCLYFHLAMPLLIPSPLEGLVGAMNLLKMGGRCAVLTFSPPERPGWYWNVCIWNRGTHSLVIQGNGKPGTMEIYGVYHFLDEFSFKPVFLWLESNVCLPEGVFVCRRRVVHEFFRNHEDAPAEDVRELSPQRRRGMISLKMCLKKSWTIQRWDTVQLLGILQLYSTLFN